MSNYFRSGAYISDSKNIRKSRKVHRAANGMDFEAGEPPEALISYVDGFVFLHWMAWSLHFRCVQVLGMADKALLPYN